MRELVNKELSIEERTTRFLNFIVGNWNYEVTNFSQLYDPNNYPGTKEDIIYDFKITAQVINLIKLKNDVNKSHGFFVMFNSVKEDENFTMIWNRIIYFSGYMWKDFDNRYTGFNNVGQLIYNSIYFWKTQIINGSFDLDYSKKMNIEIIDLENPKCLVNLSIDKNKTFTKKIKNVEDLYIKNEYDECIKLLETCWSEEILANVFGSEKIDKKKLMLILKSKLPNSIILNEQFEEINRWLSSISKLRNGVKNKGVFHAKDTSETQKVQYEWYGLAQEDKMLYCRIYIDSSKTIFNLINTILNKNN